MLAAVPRKTQLRRPGCSNGFQSIAIDTRWREPPFGEIIHDTGTGLCGMFALD
jgi:hypothetical protein